MTLGSKANGAVEVSRNLDMGRKIIDRSLRDHTSEGINTQTTQAKMKQVEEGRTFHSLREVNSIDLTVNLWGKCRLAGSEFHKVSLTISSARETICSVRGAMCNGNMAANMMHAVVT